MEGENGEGIDQYTLNENLPDSAWILHGLLNVSKGKRLEISNSGCIGEQRPKLKGLQDSR